MSNQKRQGFSKQNKISVSQSCTSTCTLFWGKTTQVSYLCDVFGFTYVARMVKVIGFKTLYLIVLQIYVKYISTLTKKYKSPIKTAKM